MAPGSAATPWHEAQEKVQECVFVVLRGVHLRGRGNRRGRDKRWVGIWRAAVVQEKVCGGEMRAGGAYDGRMWLLEAGAGLCMCIECAARSCSCRMRLRRC